MTYQTEGLMGGTLAQKCCEMAAGVEVSPRSMKRWDLDLPKLKRLSDAFRMGWLHNVMSRITPLTMRRREDYLAMADIFVENAAMARHVLDRFNADMELFCSMAGIEVTAYMTADTVSPELKAHVELYRDVNRIFAEKFAVEMRDPVQILAESSIVAEEANPFIRQFLDSRFKPVK